MAELPVPPNGERFDGGLLRMDTMLEGAGHKGLAETFFIFFLTLRENSKEKCKMGKEESRKRRNVNKWRESKEEGVLDTNHGVQHIASFNQNLSVS